MKYTQRQQEIIDTAIAIIAEGGVQDLTVKNIAIRIGISEPALYRHFKNKLAILEAIMDHFSTWSHSTMDEINGSALSPTDKVRELFRRYTQYFSTSPATSAVLFSEEIFRYESSLSYSMMSIMKHAESTIRGIMEDGVSAGAFRCDLPVEHLILTTLGTLRLLVTRWRMQLYRFDLPEEGAAAADSIIAMIS
jgi:TetR/AcrR family transcriptional regulator, fatty acid metabolism regulator protein